MFRKVLIANRGEIAVRVIQACQELGIRAVAVYSEADRDALHVARADEALPIGPAPAAESYLDIDRIVEAARQCGAEAVHPGYGFLSENAAFAEACAAAGVVFVGPPPDALRLLGDKAAAKRLARRARVPVVRGYDGAAQSPARLLGRARAVGFPLLIKAVAGGGGRGMRRAADAESFPAALAQAQREARAAFGDARVLLERDLSPARHVEVQFLADQHGAALAIGERDCSVQRRHQKLIEEAPAPGLDPADRARLGRWAVRLARQAGYVGAGTAEFLRDANGGYYFLEVNARLQVEHPVTEIVYGVDLVHWQLRIAGGEPLTLRPVDVQPRGHAVEARLYAEDPAAGFVPTSGTLSAFAPPLGPGLRHDVGVRAGDTVSRYYDTLLAKLIAYGVDREQALARLAWALERYAIQGLPTNQRLLWAIATEPDFRAARLATDFFDAHPALLAPPLLPDAALWAAAAADLAGLGHPAPDAAAPPAWAAGPWRGGAAPRVLRYALDGHTHAVGARPATPGAWTVRREADGPAPVASAGASAAPADSAADASAGGRGSGRGAPGSAAPGATEHRLEASGAGGALVARLDGAPLAATVAPLADDAGWEVQVGGGQYRLARPPAPRVLAAGADGGAAGASSDGVRAPSAGVVVALHVRAGDAVADGQPLLAIESMKIEQSLVAPRAGRVRRVACHLGDNVAGGTLLVELEEESGR